MNAINVIRPYKDGQTWVFDDEARGLNKEAFVAGADVLVAGMAKEKGIPEPEKGFDLIFSEFSFPGGEFEFELVGPDEQDVGHYYQDPSSGFVGWLCPALLKYFDTAPERIFCQVKK